MEGGHKIGHSFFRRSRVPLECQGRGGSPLPTPRNRYRVSWRILKKSIEWRSLSRLFSEHLPESKILAQ